MGADVSDIQEHLAYQFNIEDEEAGGAFYVEVKTACSLWSHMSFTTEMRCLSVHQRYFERLRRVRWDPVWAFTTQKLRVEGNIDKALKLNDIIQRKKKRRRRKPKRRKRKRRRKPRRLKRSEEGSS